MTKLSKTLILKLQKETAQKIKEHGIASGPLFRHGAEWMFEAMQPIVKANEYYADKKNWYLTSVESGSNTFMVIGSTDTEGNNWIGGFRARKARKEVFGE